jgi:U3 small nucleolar RNA-associated protein 20
MKLKQNYWKDRLLSRERNLLNCWWISSTNTRRVCHRSCRYLHFIVETLTSSLTRGYQVHVLGYTLHAVLVKTIPLVQSGEIDYCMGGMTSIIEEDILGEAGDEKDVEGLAKKMKETRHTMSYESLRLLAQAGGFAAVCKELVGLVRVNLPKSLNPKVKTKLDEMLRNIASGLIQNPAAGGLEVLVLTHGLVEEGLKWEAEQAASKRKKKEDNQARSTGGNLKTVLDKVGTSLGKKSPLDGPAEEQLVPNQQMLVEFGLQLMHSCFKRNKVNGSDPKLAPLLNPMVELLNQCLDSRHDSALTLAMKNLGYLVRSPLTAIRTSESGIADRLFAIVRRSGRSSSPLLQESLKLLTTLLRYGKTCEFTEAQLRVILTAPVFIDLEEGTTRATAFGLLKAIVGRKLVVPEMYDLMVRVGQLMVRSQDTSVRQLCSQTLLQFLLDFPLGQRRLQQHLEFLASNLAYEHPSGREAALEMIHATIVKFPEQLVDENGNFFFLPLVTRLVNDDNQQCRAMVGAVLKVLMGRVGPPARQRMLEFAMAWYAGEREELWRPAAQVRAS